MRVKPLPRLPSRHRDVSKQTVAAVLVVAILVSLLGTWFVLDSLTSTSQNTFSTVQITDAGKISVGVIGAQAPVNTNLGGQISLQVIR